VSGINFVVDEKGDKKSVIIELDLHGSLWEDFHDAMVVRSRKKEPRESLAQVADRLKKRGVNEYTILFARSARRELEGLPAQVAGAHFGKNPAARRTSATSWIKEATRHIRFLAHPGRRLACNLRNI
jgi:hypothetical protein